MDNPNGKKAVNVTYDSKDIVVKYAEYDVDGNEITSTYAKKMHTQEPLLSGYNIKTVNGQSILGSGDLQITASGSSESVDQLREDLSTVALTGDYNDLKNLPEQQVTNIYVNGASVMSGTVAYITIPQSQPVPTKLSDLVNDVGYITSAQAGSGSSSFTENYETVTTSELAELGITPEDLE